MLNKTRWKGVATVAAALALGAGGVAISSALDNNSASASGTATQPANGTTPPSGNQGTPGGPMGGTAVTGAAAQKASAAALARYPGTVEHVTQGPNGGYVVHVIKKDGSEVHVLVSDAFKVTGVETRRPGAGPMPGGGAPPNGQPPGVSPPSGMPPGDSSSPGSSGTSTT